MNLLINIANVRHGGGIAVVKHLLEHMLPLRQKDNLILLCPKLEVYQQLQRQYVQMVYVPDSFHKPGIQKYRINNFVFPALLEKYKVDKIVSLGNVAFPPKRRPQLLLLQTAQLLYPESPAWCIMERRDYIRNKLMTTYIRSNMRHASSFAVQTSVMKERLCHLYRIPEDRIYILPNAPSPQLPDCQTERGMRKEQYSLLFLRHYYGHKNFEILLPLGQLIKEQKLPFTITVTINKDESKSAARFLDIIERRGLERVLKNIGTIPANQTAATLCSYDALFLPTLLESFSGVYADAIAMGIPVLTSNMDFAKAVCGEAAWYFDPMDASHIVTVLLQAFANPELLADKSRVAKELKAAMLGWPEIAASFSGIIDRFA